MREIKIPSLKDTKQLYSVQEEGQHGFVVKYKRNCPSNLIGITKPPTFRRHTTTIEDHRDDSYSPIRQMKNNWEGHNLVRSQNV